MNSAVKSIFCSLVLMAFGLFALSSCTQGNRDRGATRRSGSVSVLADVSLRLPIQDLAMNYQQETSIKVKFKFASSQDIHPDDPADSVDLYILANDNTASTLLDTASFDPSRKRVLGYMIPCIIVPQFNPALVTDLVDLTHRDLRIGICDPNRDVLGQFAIEILQKNRVYNSLSNHLVIVPSALDLAQRVAKKELDVAIGWTIFPTWTQGGTEVILMAASEIPRVASITARRSQAAMDSTQAVKLMTFLGSDRALDVFRRWGYLISKTDIEMYATVASIGGIPEAPQASQADR